MIEAVRLLGFAFAAADLLFEVAADGRILFVMGASSLFGEAAEPGEAGGALFAAKDAARFADLARNLAPGDRYGPLSVTLASGEPAVLSLCHLPQTPGRISCTLVRPGKRVSLAPKPATPAPARPPDPPASAIDAETGLGDRESLLAAAATAAAGHPEAGLALVNLPKLPDVCATLAPAAADKLLSRIGDSVKTMNALAAGRISQTGFGVVSDDPNAAAALTKRIMTAVREHGIDTLEAEEVLVSLKNRGLTPEQTMLAVRHVVGRFAESNLEGAPGDLGEAFDDMLSETLDRARMLNITVSEGAFDLVFEPIVDLQSGVPVHYEALTRFAPGESPAETIQFAEELGLSETLDLSVMLKVFTLLERESGSDASIAVNVSARSIASTSTFAMLAGLLMKRRALADRLLIEITESADIGDMATANKAIQAMREMGYRVGIDDFGSGAASLQYLQGFAVDFVKVDGALIRRLGKSPREDSFLRGVLRTCADLKVESIAEWIDSDDKLQRCRALGFHLGQGRHFGGALTVFPRPMALHAQTPRGISMRAHG